MNIVLIGTGNVAVVLSKKLMAAGHAIVQVAGRNHQAAAALAGAVNAAVCDNPAAITMEADLYIIAVADKALAGNEIRLTLKDQLLVHTAGAVSINVLKNMSAAYGVLYPYQSIRKEIEPLPDIPFMVDGNTTAVKDQLLTLAAGMSDKVIVAGDQERMQYHLCAVAANNFSNYLYVLTDNFCRAHGLDFTMLLPVIDETARRLHQFPPRQVQTGPAIRKDTGTIQQHLQLLKDDPALKKLYEIFSAEMLQYPW